MYLRAGTRIGPYHVIAPIGAGGMGEVYRAEDTRLGRTVAIKILPDAFAADAERIARFDREARLLAALNHPSIATIYGIEEAGASRFLVLELVEGGTLSDRLARRPLPIPDALRIARDVADALHAAHERGIIHRDLKPANIALTTAGKPKVLDFGLAKALANDTGETTTDGGTRAGVMLGTIPYMSPEAARGALADKRSDLWSFGCVLYEMLTGRTPFAGPSSSDVVAAILSKEPDLSALPPDTPPRVRVLLRRLLEKDPSRRLHDAADARIEIEDALAHPQSADGPTGTGPAVGGASRTRERIAWTAAAIAVIALVAAMLLGDRNERPAAGQTSAVSRSAILLPENLRLTTPDPAARFAISPDGERLALVAADATGVPMLWVRPLDSLTAQSIPGTEGASYPFWSPDSRSIAFIARPAAQANLGSSGLLRRVDTRGGEPVTLASQAFNATGAWGRDHTILFTPTGNSPLFQVSATSPSEPVAVGALDEESGDVQHSYPSFLPDGRHFVYTVLGSRTGANEARAVYLGSLDGAPPRLLIEAGSHGKYTNGHILFLRDATLLAQPFDVATLSLGGDAIPIAHGVQITPRVSGGTGAFTASDTGVLVYQTGVGVRSQLQWIDRSGKPIADLGDQADYGDVALSPDGTRALVSALDPRLGTRDLLDFDVSRGVYERFTSSPSDDYAPVWSHGGDRVAFTSARDGSIDLYVRSVAGDPRERKLDSGGSRLGKFAAAWSRDGWLLFIAGGRALARSDIHMVHVDGGGRPKPLLESPAVETQVRPSPDGRWIAYASNESGRIEVYVRPFPGPGDRTRVSTVGAGGAWPRWRSDGREIFYLAPKADGTSYSVMAIGVSTERTSLSLEQPRQLFDVPLRPIGRLDAYPYDVDPKGRFLFNTFVEEATSTGLTLVVNWPETARQR